MPAVSRGDFDQSLDSGRDLAYGDPNAAYNARPLGIASSPNIAFNAIRSIPRPAERHRADGGSGLSGLNRR
jgi:hypothetical protein